MNELSHTPKNSFGGYGEGSNSSRNNFTSHDRQKLNDLNNLVSDYANKLKQVVASFSYVSEKVAIGIYRDEIVRWKSDFSQNNFRKGSVRIYRSYVRAKNICQNLETHFQFKAGEK